MIINSQKWLARTLNDDHDDENDSNVMSNSNDVAYITKIELKLYSNNK